MLRPQMWSSQPPCEGCSIVSRAQVRKQSSERGSGVFNVTQSQWHSQDNRRPRNLPSTSTYQKLRSWLPALAITLIIIIYHSRRSLRDLLEAEDKPTAPCQRSLQWLPLPPTSVCAHHELALARPSGDPLITSQAFSPLTSL